MKSIRPFTYVKAQSIKEACSVLSAENALLLAGGTDVLVNMKEKDLAPEYVVDIKAIPGISGIRVIADGKYEIGAATTIHEIVMNRDLQRDFPHLPEEAVQLGSYQVRTRATIGGNLCSASTSAEMSPGLLVLNACLFTDNGTVQRKIPCNEFFVGPGKSALEKGEMLTAVQFEKLKPNSSTAFEKFGPRGAMDIAVVNVAALLELSPDGVCTGARIGMGTVAPTPILAPKAAGYLIGKVVNNDSLRKAADIAADEDARPRDSRRGSAKYRRELVRALAYRTLERAYQRIVGRKPS